ncbi:MAG: P83/100 family protein [Spirochaetia bacterium]
MKKKVFICITVLFYTMLLSGQEVAENELERYESRSVEYVNFSGEHEFFNTAEEIRNIGRTLSRTFREDGESVFAGKYALLRISPPGDGLAFGADILSFKLEARVDHIDNIRRILDGYLTESFGYAPSEARSLSEAITRYNTLLRGRIDYFSERYTPEVVEMLEEETLGLSRYYDEWAGATSIVVPLVAEDETPDTVSTEAKAAPDRSSGETAEEEAEPGPDLRPDETPDETPETTEKEVSEQEARIAEEEVRSLEEEPDFTALPERGKRGIGSLWWFIGGGLFLIFLILILVLLLRRRAEKVGEAPYAAASYAASKAPRRRGRAGLQQPLLMRVVYRGYLLSRKVFGEVLPGEVKSVGGKGAYFAIPYGSFPRKIGEVENRKGEYVLNPVKPEFFPELDLPGKGILEKEIHLEDRNGEKVVLFFHLYVSPLEKINRLLRSITGPGKEPPE